MVQLKDAETGESHNFEIVHDNEGQPLGRVDWMAVMETFRASRVDVIADGVEVTLSIYRSGEKEGLTRRLFKPDDMMEVRVERKEDGVPGWVDPLLHPDHTSRMSAHEAVARLIVKEADNGPSVNAGTIVRVSPSGVMVTARHSCIDGGVLLDLRAFGAKLEFIAASPYDDLIFLRGPAGPHLTLVEAGHLVLGRPVTLLAFPQAVDEELELPSNVSPTSTRGSVAAFDSTGSLVAADYGGAMPNSSGGGVLLDTKHLCGIHTGDLFHSDNSELHPEDSKEGPKPPKHLERDPSVLWKDEGPVKPLAGNPNSAAKLRALRHAVRNLDFKASLGTFVPSNRIIELLIDLGLQAKDDLKIAAQSSASRKRYKRS